MYEGTYYIIIALFNYMMKWVVNHVPLAKSDSMMLEIANPKYYEMVYCEI